MKIGKRWEREVENRDGWSILNNTGEDLAVGRDNGGYLRRRCKLITPQGIIGTVGRPPAGGMCQNSRSSLGLKLIPRSYFLSGLVLTQTLTKN